MHRIIFITGLFFVFLAGWIQAGFSQQDIYPFEIKEYPFIRYGQNRIDFPADSSAFECMYDKLDELILKGAGQVSIVHIGGSHIQADIYTHQVRKRLQTFYPGLNGGRGFVFPYRVAGTNNPSNYGVRYSGEWSSCKNTTRNNDCRLGLSGMSVTTDDTSACISIWLNRDSSVFYDFNRVRIFHPFDTALFDLIPETPGGPFLALANEDLGYTEFLFAGHADSLTLRFAKNRPSQHYFQLFGFSFENSNPGIRYNAIGVNGSRLDSYLHCEDFGRHLKALDPDLVIISIGTNDAYTRNFDKELYKSNYKRLIRAIREAEPGAAIMMTVPNDSYLYRRYANENTVVMKNVIFELAAEYNCGVWDFYSIMGGFDSSYTWYMSDLMRKDKIHFNRPGYELKGNLFFNAILRSYENHVEQISGINNPGKQYMSDF